MSMKAKIQIGMNINFMRITCDLKNKLFTHEMSMIAKTQTEMIINFMRIPSGLLKTNY